MPFRPLYLTFICWLLIFAFLVNIIAFTITVSNPALLEPMLNLRKQNNLPMTVQFVIQGIDYCVLLTSGIAMLRRRNWGRRLFVSWFAISSVISLATVLVKMIILPGVVIYLIVACLLFLPGANRYFAANQPVISENSS